MEVPERIKKSFGLARGKNDRIDAFQITAVRLRSQGVFTVEPFAGPDG
jgi:hypothetical protein